MDSSTGPTQKALRQAMVKDGVLDPFQRLPEEIISNILSLVPTKNAVATCVLSKDWKNRWKNVTNFDIDDEQLSDRRVPRMEFLEFIQGILNNQTASSPNHFRLHSNSPSSCRRRSFLTRWRRNINPVKLPGELYTAKNLTVPKLSGNITVKLPNSICLPKMLVLELCMVTFVPEDCVNKFISACPMLHSLKMKRNWYDDGELRVCTISSPTLKHLWINFEGNQNVSLEINACGLEYVVLRDFASRDITIQRLTSVIEADLEIYMAHDEDDMVVKLVMDFDSAEFLKLGPNIMAVFGNIIALSDVLSNARFERLIKLVVTYDPSWQKDGLLDFLGCCVKLESIEIVCSRFENPYDGFEDDDEYEGDESLDEKGDESENEDDESDDEEDEEGEYANTDDEEHQRWLMSLTQVTIKRFDDDLIGLMELLKFILCRGRVLERVNLCFDDSDAYIDSKGRDRALNKVRMLPKASTDC